MTRLKLEFMETTVVKHNVTASFPNGVSDVLSKIEKLPESERCNLSKYIEKLKSFGATIESVNEGKLEDTDTESFCLDDWTEA